MADAPPINRPRGTRDFGPAETHVRAHVGARMRQVFRRFGYREVQTPTFEELALFTAKSGEGVVGELYDFKDKGGRDLCLRPELTAPAMRMYFQEHFNDPKPLKWFYFGNCFRYDRPQAGRYREFWQFGCEQIGAGTPLAYAELLALADAVMADVGLMERDFFVGHVGILSRLVDSWDLHPNPDVAPLAPTEPQAYAERRAQLMRAIDKQLPLEIEAILGSAVNTSPQRIRQFLDLIEPVSADSVTNLGSKIEEYDGRVALRCADAITELESVFSNLQTFGIQNVKLNLGIARGLDYYTGIVFEMHCPILGAEKQLLGGGGYDLSHVFGGQPTPTMGFGLGFDRTIVALEKQAELAGQALAFPPDDGPALYVAALSEAASKRVLPIVASLRARGVEVELDLLGRKPGAVAKHADAVGARRLAIVGDRDLEAGAVQVKELATGNMDLVPLGELSARDWA